MTTFPGIAGQIEEAIGVELTTLLLRRWGGCEVSIPKHAQGTKLAEVIGMEAAEILIREIGHGKLVLPCATLRGAKRRRAEAIALLRRGMSASQVALACDLHTRTVHAYRAALTAEDNAAQLQLPFDI
ncbi:helix-turn-helix domain-containing protein [Gemmobacter serpentinus]|uniref:helix-turn-helix domain-containing protein n=1 Tax=Gemmobacter serpentinus TaxID=2652247 RepID=UPI00124C5859|nr:helix-turn-helix domain-containing protein [Gemmobacter serpentinus]